MRITVPLLQRSSAVPVEEAEYIDLSRKDIMVIERLSICERLRTLILTGNNIKAIHNIDCCRQLWSLDISGNKLKSLYGLSRFPVLGSVCLGGNELDWKELHRISHITILTLTLVGNPQLDSDPNYRRHVVDMLPNVWMLDGKIITAEEHKQVEEFFNESQTSAHPVRRKASETVFIPTSLKNLLVDGVFGDKTAHMMSKFPINYIHNTEMDKKRLSYLIHSIGDDMKLAQGHLATVPSTAHTLSTTSEEPNDFFTRKKLHQCPNLQSLFDHRKEEVEQCNMLLLLMLAGLEYSIPSKVMQTTLETAKLTSIGDVQCMDLFLLPRSMMVDIASLLLSAATVDRLENKDGGLYSQLYKSLCFTMEAVQRKKHASRKLTGLSKSNHAVWRCLLASEVVHLMCLVPHFFESLQTSEGLMKMTVVATKNANVSDVISDIIWRVQTKGGDVWEVYQEIASYLLQVTSENVVGKRKKCSTMQTSIHRTTSQLLHYYVSKSTQPRLSPQMLRAKSAGAVKKMSSRRIPKSAGVNRAIKEPEMGDMVIMSAEQVARIVAFPDPRTVVLQINSYPTSLSSSHPDAYFYMDTNGLAWDRQFKCWTKDSLHSDISYSHLSDSVSFSTTPTFESVTSLNEYITSRAATPEQGTYHAPRPLSGMSFRSDDLQTIPSQEEITDDDDHVERPSSTTSSPRSVPLSPIKVDFGLTAQSSTSITSESDHQKHVLQQYSINQLQANNSVTPKAQSTVPVHQDGNISPRSQALQDLQKSTRYAEKKGNQESENFTVPTPHLQLSEIWETEKSVPRVSSSHYYKPHSCRRTELNRQNHLVESHMSPTPVLSTSPQMLSPFCTSPSDDLESPSFVSFTHDKPVLYNAWSVAKPNASTKHSLLTSSRLMHKQQPKTPPVTRQSNEIYSEHGSGTCAILRTRQQRQQQTQPMQQNPSVYNAHIGKSVGKYHYHHPKKNVEGVRKLGKTKVTPDLFIGNGKRR